MRLSVKLPLFISENDGAYGAIDNYLDLINQNLRTLILTNPGEKIMDPSYGVGPQRFLFENANSVSELNSVIYGQVNKYLSFIKIVNINSVIEDQVFSIKLTYDVESIGISGILDFSTRIQG
jgi:phage baseplate assembly protein W